MNKLLLFTLLMLTIACYDQQCNCKMYKTGTFEFTQQINGKKNKTIFNRTKNVQIETYNGKTDTASVRWLNECEFVIQKIHPKNMQEQKAITMRILSTTQNSYTFEYSYIGSEKKEKGVATKL